MSYLKEDEITYPVSFNGKMRFKVQLSSNLSKSEIELEIMKYEKTIQYLDGRSPKNVIVVPNKIVNIVI